MKLVNPYFIKQLPGRKSDVRDAAWIAEYTMKGLIRGSSVPEPLVQQMRQYNRRIFDLTKEKVYKLTNWLPASTVQHPYQQLCFQHGM
ncbi:IS110 family transposase [Phocaeicola barnesiae]|uniref:IS110 family transposase n=1 Tax=Phocaeicola barnesiae TaxID=376804 RepID=UPI002430BBC7|nr:transposase [Phocaeicola barnesiae]